jgi:hypothetical protein
MTTQNPSDSAQPMRRHPVVFLAAGGHRSRHPGAVCEHPMSERHNVSMNTHLSIAETPIHFPFFLAFRDLFSFIQSAVPQFRESGSYSKAISPPSHCVICFKDE